MNISEKGKDISKSVLELIRLDGKFAVVTGGGGHLGREISRALLELGAEVLILGRNQQKVEPLGVEFGSRVSFEKIDLNSKDEVLKLRDTLPKKIDVLVNNALTWPKNPHFEELNWDEVNETLVSGITSPLMLTKIVFERMIPCRLGSIINNASMYGMVSPDFRIYRDSGMGNAIAYNAVKAALIQFTRYLAVKGAPYNIRVNAFSPGPFSHPGTFDGGKEWFRQELNRKVPLNRIGESWEIKGVIAFLVSDLSTYVTGQNIPIDGGWTIW